MRSKQFRPVGVDALEDRLVLSAFTAPIQITIVPAGHVNSKNLVLTKHTESQLAPLISSAFHRYQVTLVKDFQAIVQAYNKTGTVPTALVNAAPAQLNAATTKLASDLLAVAHKLPYGGTNAYPVLESRLLGSPAGPAAGAGFNATPLQTELSVLETTTTELAQEILTDKPQYVATELNYLKNGTLVEGKALIAAAQNQVQTDVNDYIHLGVQGGYFKLGRGATLPSL